ncbi:MAG: STAS domain-containing protein [Actinomycetota bacterium]
MAYAVTVTVEERAGGTVVRVAGVVDAAALPDVSRALTDAQREDSHPVYVELSQVTFMDSRGLGALLAAHERHREGAAPLRIVRPSDAVRRLLDAAGVAAILTEADALPE